MVDEAQSPLGRVRTYIRHRITYRIYITTGFPADFDPPHNTIHSGVNYGLVIFLQRQVSIAVIQLLLLLVGLSAFILCLIALI